MDDFGLGRQFGSDLLLGAAEQEGPALLFSNFKNYPAGFRVISNVFRTCKRTGPAMGIEPELDGVDYLYAWRKKLAAYKPVPAAQVENGLRAVSLADIRWQWCQIKSISLQGAAILRQQAIDAGADDYVRAHAHAFNISNEFFNKCDVHMHIPSGAQPKDGPSAGVTMATSIISLMVPSSRTRSNVRSRACRRR